MWWLWGHDAAYVEPLLLIGSEATPVEASMPYFCHLCVSPLQVNARVHMSYYFSIIFFDISSCRIADEDDWL